MSAPSRSEASDLQQLERRAFLDGALALAESVTLPVLLVRSTDDGAAGLEIAGANAAARLSLEPSWPTLDGVFRDGAAVRRALWDTLQARTTRETRFERHVDPEGRACAARLFVLSDALIGISFDEPEPLPASSGRSDATRQRLEQSLVTRTEQLRDVEAQLWHAQKMEAVARLAGGVAHDFNNLLAVVMINAQLAEETARSAGASTDSLVEIVLAAERGAALTRQLLVFSRREVVGSAPVDLWAVVQTVEPLIRRALGEAVALAIVRKTPSIGFVLADRSQMEQVLMNLVVNARDAMSSGGRLAIEIGEVEAASAGDGESQPVPGRHVRLTVRDTGAGMSEDVKKRAFEPFYTTKEKGKGTGLGLATTYSIVRRCRGVIHIASELGRGTTVTVDLPRIGDEDARPREASPRPRPGLPRDMVVLVVDDDPAVRRGVALLLRRAGHAVHEASNVSEGLTVLASVPEITFLVTDVMLPDGDGLTLARRAASGGRQLRVLFISGYADDVVTGDAIIGEELHFLQKPASPDALLSKILEVVADVPFGQPRLP